MDPRPANLDDATDEQLLSAHRDGHAVAFRRLVERYQRELFHFLVRFMGDRAAADDVFQEAFLQVHQSAASFDVERNFRPWLFTIAANKGRDFMRAAARRPAAPLQATLSSGGEGTEFIELLQSMEAAPDANLEKSEVQALVQRTIDRLPAHLKEILLLAYFHQFPYRQIADMLDIPLGTVKSRLHSAVGAFADLWNSTNRQKDLS